MKTLSKLIVLLIPAISLFQGCSLFNQNEKPRELTLFHWNDFHSTNTPFLKKPQLPDTSKPYWVSGYANFSAYLDSLRNANPSNLTLFTGDEFQGSPVYAVTKGASQINLIRLLNPDVMIPGNHEFDYGDSLYFAMTDSANLPLISSNLVKKSDGSLFFPDYSWKEVNGIKIAIMGVMMDDLYRYTMPTRIGLITVEPTVPAIRKTMERVKLERGKPDLWLLLSHSGLDADQRTAKEIPELDVILSAHDHEKTNQPIRIGKTLIAEAGYRGQFIGEMKLLLPKENPDSIQFSYKLIETRAGVLKPIQPVANLVNSYEEVLGKELNQVIGELKVFWPMPEAEENGAANFITDGLIEATGADIGIVNAGGIRKPMNSGQITVRDCWELQPFSNLVIVFKLSGRELEKAISFSLLNSDTPLHFAGIELILHQHAARSFSLAKLTRNGKPLNPDQIYNIVTNNYIGQNLKRTFDLEQSQVEMSETGLIDREVVSERIKRLKIIDTVPDGRRLIIPIP
ncbi:MAG: bifunctional metallophosphatase/5'-nucleotidase [Bacteroidetes bacterium]|nr:bifunctional metallophosphatase/5'-nucleotidase [Bacteroidota bacterium]